MLLLKHKNVAKNIKILFLKYFRMELLNAEKTQMRDNILSHESAENAEVLQIPRIRKVSEL